MDNKLTRAITVVVFTAIIVFQIVALFIDVALPTRALDVVSVLAFSMLAVWYIVRPPQGVSRQMQVFVVAMFVLFALSRAYVLTR